MNRLCVVKWSLPLHFHSSLLCASLMSTLLFSIHQLYFHSSLPCNTQVSTRREYSTRPLWFALCALRPAPCALRPAPCALRSASGRSEGGRARLRSAPCALRSALGFSS